jgi:antitoxin HigA-1
MREGRLKNVHPGEVLAEEFLAPLGISTYRLALDTGVPLTRIAALVHGRRAVTADTALRLARYFGTSPRFWLGLQDDYDLEETSTTKGNELSSIVPLSYGARPRRRPRRSSPRAAARRPPKRNQP